MGDAASAEFRDILETTKRVTARLREAGVPFALGGSVACWARGGPETVNDVDLLVAESDSGAALGLLREEGLEIEQAPEHWLIKAWDGDVLVDLIFELTGVGRSEQVIERAERMRVAALDLPVARMEDVLTAKLMALDEHNLDLASPLSIARATREQIDWSELRRLTEGSPYAAAFFTLVDRLGVCEPADPAPGSGAGPQIRVVS
jgi:hypothetical protein